MTHCVYRRQITFLRCLCMAKPSQNGRVELKAHWTVQWCHFSLTKSSRYTPQLSGQLNSLCLSRCWPNLLRLAAYVAHLHVLTPSVCGCMCTMSAFTWGLSAFAKLTSHDSFSFWHRCLFYFKQREPLTNWELDSRDINCSFNPGPQEHFFFNSLLVKKYTCIKAFINTFHNYQSALQFLLALLSVSVSLSSLFYFSTQLFCSWPLTAGSCLQQKKL